MTQKWITKGKGDEKRRFAIENDRKQREVQISTIGPSVSDLEKEAWGMLGDLSKITSVDDLLLKLKKYSGTLGDYSSFNSLLITFQFETPTIVRSKAEWGYFGRTVNEDATRINVLYPIGIPKKDGPGKVKEFIEKKRKEGLSDEAIDELLREKFDAEGGGLTHIFSVGSVYDISQTTVIPGKGKPVEDNAKAGIPLQYP